MRTWQQRIHRAEDALLAVLLSAMIGLAATQILLRNLFDTGIVWIDPLLRVLVLWLGLVGAMVATRYNKHISIDLLTRYLKGRLQYLLQALVEQLSAWTCLVIAFHGFNWVFLDFADGLEAFSGIPSWMLEIIIPASFAVIGLRYLLLSWGSARLYIERRNAPDEPAE